MAGEIYFDIDLDFTISSAPPVIDLTQYGNVLPVVRATLYSGGLTYTIPDGATVNLRLCKPSGNVAYLTASGAGSSVAKIALTESCLDESGSCPACFEITSSDGTFDTPIFIVRCDENPIQARTVAASSDFQAIVAYKNAAAASATAAANSESNASKSATSAANSASAAATSATEAQAAVDAPDIGLSVVDGQLCITYTE